jgi:hypothetical protein
MKMDLFRSASLTIQYGEGFKRTDTPFMLKSDFAQPSNRSFLKAVRVITDRRVMRICVR